MTKPAPENYTKPSLTEAAARSNRASRALLSIICFLAGAAIMVIEISANRLLAPHFGNSVYTWTALIGVLLVAISVGGYLGGILSDKLGRMDLIGWLLAGASVLTMLIPSISLVLGPALADAGLISGPLWASLFLLALPGVLLGAVSPASVRFYSLLNQDQHVGIAAGTISMLGSLGSFVGTFVTGFFLLSTFGVKAIFLGSGAVLMLLALLAFWMAGKSLKVHVSTAAVILIAGLITYQAEASIDELTIHQENSFYHQIEVQERISGDSKDRFLKLDSTMEGGMRMNDGGLLLEYQNFWRLVLLNEDIKLQRALFVGAGAFGMPEEVSRVVAGSEVDVVEIDPAVIGVGHRFFKLDEHPHVHAYASDARRFLNKSDGGYDFIFGDAYNGVQHIPSHLVTREFFTVIKSKLSPKGVFLMNVITAVEGEKADLLGHLLATVRAVFPHVEVFAVNGYQSSPQNVILLATQEDWSPWLESRRYISNSWQEKLVSRRLPEGKLPAERSPFTDDFNPVDAVIARQLLK
ncbi:fused MFS/spermidine synthase [soil metagenome]